MSLAALLRRIVPPALPATLDIAGRDVPVALRRSARARRASLRADAVAGEVRVTLPPRAPIAVAAALLADHHGWIAARVAGWPVPLAFVDGALLPFDGGTLRLDCDAARPRGVRRDGDDLRVGGPADTHAARIHRWLRAAALAELTAATRALAAETGRPVAKVAVRDPRARWGSCAPGGAIAYSWRLLLAPGWVRHSVVAHEVAHLVHANHGAAFWRLAATLNRGDPAPARAWLRRHGAALHWVGRAG